METRQDGVQDRFEYVRSACGWNSENLLRLRDLLIFADHPDHVAFVRDRWVPEVEKFLEIDYVPLV